MLAKNYLSSRQAGAKVAKNPIYPKHILSSIFCIHYSTFNNYHID